MKRLWVVALIVGSAVACGGDDPTADTGPSRQLAPSQISAPTVPAPVVPPSCDLADLELWTARVVVAERSADAVIRVRNRGAGWCEPDVYGSPRIDPEIEPDVWLHPDDWADLVVSSSGDTCGEPQIVDRVEVDVHGETRSVPSAAIQPCGWWLAAFYPAELATAPCDRLDVADVDGFVVVRNAATTACVLGELTAVDGNGASGVAGGSGIDVVDLAPGDVAAVRYTAGPEGCAADRAPGTLTFAGAGVVPVAAVACGGRYELGPARPWYGAPDGPLANLPAGGFELAAALAALDPFGTSGGP
ncbi:MAG TPA: hypothetical protein VIS05_04685 [Ilumatobacter sp.]